MPKWAIAVIVIILILCCCVLAVAVATGGLAAYGLTLESQVTDAPFTLFSTPEVNSPDLPDVPELDLPDLDPTRTVQPTIVQQEDLSGAEETLQTLLDTLVPNGDPIELAARLKGITDVPTVVDQPLPTKTGETKKFWVSNVDNNDNAQVTATLEYVGEHILFWVENGVNFDRSALDALASTFDNEIYQTDREFFGSEWTPGVDNDARIYVLYATGGGSIAGYFSAVDSLPPQIEEYSNAHEMFFISAEYVDLSEDYVYSTLAHEFQHMIHWYRDRNEETWLNEGFSELATLLNGYEAGGFDYIYTSDPDLQLNDWPQGNNNTEPHYGAGFLFTTYFLDRFGEDATKAVIGEQDNGLKSFDLVFSDLDIQNPSTGTTMTADDFFADWTVANYLNDPGVADGRYSYHNYSGLFSPTDTDVLSDCPSSPHEYTVSQYGVDYIRVACSGPQTILFEGSQEVKNQDADPYSGLYAFWSNRGDDSDMTLTHEFDFSAVSGPINLNYYTWYDVEEDFDYVYVLASTDGGTTWDFLRTPSGTDADPTGANYNWGYNGQSGDWIEETVDLSDYAGKNVLIRFEYITDPGLNGEGFLLDDISIPEIDYATDFESDDGGWQAEGFARIQNRLPQTFRLTLIQLGSSPSVEYIDVNADQTASIQLDLNDDAVLVVSGTTRFTTQPASYRVTIQ